MPVLLFVSAAATGMVYAASWGGTPHFFQELFGPSAMFACGKGFVNPPLEQAPALDTFLHPAMHVDHPPEQDCFSCDQIPTTLVQKPLESFQRRQLYLLGAVAILWRWLGVAWSSLTPLYGLLFGASALAAYGLFRLAMNRAIAAACAILLFLSPIQLNNLVRLRDYSKAPFILAAILIMAYLVKTPFSRRKLFLSSLACGLTLGVGCGFRMDVLICIPAFIAVVCLFLNARPFAHWAARMAGIAVFLGVFFLSSYPIFRALETGMKYQDFLLGFNDLYDSRLGVGGAPYQIGHRYFDYEPLAILHAYGKHAEGKPVHYAFDTPEYEAVGAEYSHLVLKTFPADIILRAYAAVIRTIDELTSNPANPAPRGIANAAALKFWGIHAHITGYLLRYARYAVAAALLLLSLRNLRWAFAALFFLLYFGGYGAVQFASRHYFHLQFLSLWAAGLLLCVAGAAFLAAAHKKQREHWRTWALGENASWRSAAIRPLLFSLATAALLILPLSAARWRQTEQVRSVLKTYELAEREPVQLLVEPRENETVLIRGADGAGRAALPGPEAAPYFEEEYLAAEFDTSQGGVTFTAQYSGSVPDLALTWAKTLPKTSAGSTTLYFPVYYALWKGSGQGWSRYEGLVLSSADAAKLKGLFRIKNPEQYPFLLTAELTPGWENGRLYQRFVR